MAVVDEAAGVTPSEEIYAAVSYSDCLDCQARCDCRYSCIGSEGFGVGRSEEHVSASQQSRTPDIHDQGCQGS